jgi:tetratricopeptide (TPR) repeat protein
LTVVQVGDGGPFERARALYEQAVFNGDESALAAADRVLDGAEAALSLARGRVMHARFLAREPADPAELALFERAAELFRQVGDQRGEAESLFWIGTYHQVAGNDSAAAVPYLDRARNLATATGDRLTLSYALRHLGFADQEAGRLDAARAEFEESVRLRRQIGFMPGVAAGLLALADRRT